MAQATLIRRYSPAAAIEFQRETAIVPNSLTEAQLEALLKEMSDEPLHMATVLADTGLRMSELRRLTWNEVDLGERTILIRNPKNRAERVIPLTVRAQAILAGRLRERKGVVVFPTQEFKRSLDSAGRRAVIGHVTLTNYVIPSPP